VSTEWYGDTPIMSREAMSYPDGARRQQRLPHGLSMMLGRGVALKGCATRPGKPASALDRDAAAKQVAVIPLWQNGHRQQNSD
jgi:hypothetical protein